jgi:hypothetical protein
MNADVVTTVAVAAATVYVCSSVDKNANLLEHHAEFTQSFFADTALVATIHTHTITLLLRSLYTLHDISTIFNIT